MKYIIVSTNVPMRLGRKKKEKKEQIKAYGGTCEQIEIIRSITLSLITIIFSHHHINIKISHLSVMIYKLRETPRIIRSSIILIFVSDDDHNLWV